jgi:hypothetical protein
VLGTVEEKNVERNDLDGDLRRVSEAGETAI